MNNIDCNKYKLEYYYCIQKLVGENVQSKLTNKVIDEIKNNKDVNIRFNDKVLNLCNNSKLGNCLTNKYNIKLSDENEHYVIEYFSNKFNKNLNDK